MLNAKILQTRHIFRELQAFEVHVCEHAETRGLRMALFGKINMPSYLFYFSFASVENYWNLKRFSI